MELRDVRKNPPRVRSAEEAGLDFGAVTQQLEAEGVALFTHAYDELIAGVDKKRQEMRGLS
jgi:hypothetical protein